MGRSLQLIVTGATGFIGGHVVAAALARGHGVTVVGRDEAKAMSAEWRRQVRFVAADIHATSFDLAVLGEADAMLHLAWPGLPDFWDPAHLEVYFPADARFLEAMQSTGLPRLLVTGTCLEYGIRNGPLAETMPAAPTLPYARAKDALRRHLEAHLPGGATLVWARLFYMHGPGQHPKSVLAQLDVAIDRGDPVFPMSGGEQLRDYLPVGEVARRLVRLAEAPSASGIFNICSGRPISIRRLVEERIAERGAAIALGLGHYPYPDYEAMAFWGDGTRFEREMERADD
jgi:dTDP-6-deoxy-L-talose 4-dehydrogenase (NAD+)